MNAPGPRIGKYLAYVDYCFHNKNNMLLENLSYSLFLCRLAEKGSTVSSKDFFSTKFIEDCISQNKYLDVAAYRYV